jgi:hypothetical protein
MELTRQKRGREPVSTYDRTVNSNGRTNFFTRWWNQPELELGALPPARMAQVHFVTPNGTQIAKEVKLVQVQIVNSGNDDAFEPEIRAIPRDSDSKDEDVSGMFSLRKMATLLSYRIMHTLSDEPDEAELAVSFLREGLHDVPLLAGSQIRGNIVFGFAFRGGSLFHLASEQVLNVVQFVIKNQAPIPFALRAKAKNSSDALLCKQTVLKIDDFETINLLLVSR